MGGWGARGLQVVRKIRLNSLMFKVLLCSPPVNHRLPQIRDWRVGGLQRKHYVITHWCCMMGALLLMLCTSVLSELTRSYFPLFGRVTERAAARYSIKS